METFDITVWFKFKSFRFERDSTDKDTKKQMRLFDELLLGMYFYIKIYKNFFIVKQQHLV